MSGRMRGLVGGVRFVNLLLAGMLAGNEFGTLAGVHPALDRLGASAENVRAEQEITRRYGMIMPFWMSAVIVSCLPTLALSRGRRFGSTLAGTLCFVAMLAMTLTRNVPINERILALSAETDAEGFARLRARWDLLHAFRVSLDVAGLAFLILGSLEASDHKSTGGRGK